MRPQAAIYVILHEPVSPEYVIYALRELRRQVDTLAVVAPPLILEQVQGWLGEQSTGRLVTVPHLFPSTHSGYKAGLDALWQQDEPAGSVLLTGSHVAGPITPLPSFLAQAQGASLYSPYWHKPQLDLRLKALTRLDRIPYLDFAVVSADLMADAGFRAFWASYVPRDNYWDDFLASLLPLAEFMAQSGREVRYPIADGVFETSDPRFYEVHKILQHRLPCLPLAVLSLDPVMHDLNAIDLRAALDELRAINPELYLALIRHVTRTIPMRDFNTIADQYEIMAETANTPGKTQWRFGRIAVFLHAFYAEMMPEFWELAQRIPCEFDFHITTSTQEHQKAIRSFLWQKGFPIDRTFVILVDQNRGRDMSSLFISFRDVALSGKYEVALRLHSKRTPQVSRQVGESFKKHLFDNLVKSPGYVSNILDKFEAEPDIGMIMPPVIHVGFGTLGHSWFSNRSAVQSLADQMGLDVPFDLDTPVAPYGTMYWFRTDALRRMFEWEWRWIDYNAEPNHVDGGLAHVQERLIGYCAQDRGYRVLAVMNPELAARGYARLEYKLQLLAARLNSGNIYFQVQQLDGLRGQVRIRLFRRLQAAYGKLIRRNPGLRAPLQPAVRLIRGLLSPSGRR